MTVRGLLPKTLSLGVGCTGVAATPWRLELDRHRDCALVTIKRARREPATPTWRLPMNATATIAPTRPQYMRALERANEVRVARARLKRRVTFGEIGIAEVILHCPFEVENMAVFDLLVSQRRWGRTRCRKLLAELPMSEKKTVGSMTDRQRHALAAMLSSAEDDSQHR
jgi:hypothetical protein